MRYARISTFVILAAMLAQAGGASAGILTLNLCGVLDNSANDLNPAPGIVEVFCPTSSGFFSGTAVESKTATSDTIIEGYKPGGAK